MRGFEIDVHVEQVLHRQLAYERKLIGVIDDRVSSCTHRRLKLDRVDERVFACDQTVG